MPLKSQALEKTFFWVLLSALLLGFFWLLSPFFTTILFALVLTLSFEPLYVWLLKISKNKRHLSAVICLSLGFLFIAVPIGGLVAAISNQLLHLARDFQWDPNIIRSVLGEGWMTQALENWLATLGIDVNLGQLLRDFLHNSAQTLYQFSPKVAVRTANFFLKGVVSLLLIYFLLVDGPKLYHAILDLSPLKENDEKMLAQEISLTLRACIYGYLLTALVQAILAGIGFWIAGVPIALLLSVATFIMAFVPIFGSASVWVPVFVFLLISGNYGKATFMAIYGFFIISGIDNVLKPILIGEKTKIHSVLLFLSIFGGLKLWGPIGILAGPVLVAVLLATLKIYKQDFR